MSASLLVTPASKVLGICRVHLLPSHILCLYKGAVLWLIYCNAVVSLFNNGTNFPGISNTSERIQHHIHWPSFTGSYVPESAVKTESMIGPQNVHRKIAAIVANHHKTGTLMFKMVLQYLSPKLGMDFEELYKLDLTDVNAAEPSIKHVYVNGTARTVNLMEGFTEDCPKGDKIWEYCFQHDVECWLNACDVRVGHSKEFSIEEIPFINTVRNPAEVVISAYLYHKQDSLAQMGQETWLQEKKPDAYWMLSEADQQKFKDVPFYKVLQQVDPEAGLQMEFSVVSSSLYNTARHYKFTAEHPKGMNVHLERAKKDYDGLMTDVLSHLGILDGRTRQENEEILKFVGQFDLKRMPPKFMDNVMVAHIASPHSDKAELRRILYRNQEIRDTLNRLAEIQGYGLALDPARLFPNGTSSNSRL